MRKETFGPAVIFLWSWEMEREMRAEARQHLFQKFQVGIYRDADIANSIIQHQFEFFSAKLNAAIQIMADRSALEFILNQYEESSKILHGHHIDDQDQKAEWLRIEGNFRRALKYIAERISLQEPTSPINTSRIDSMRAMDQALLSADMVADLAEQSNRVYGVFPQNVVATVHRPGRPVDWEVHITGRYESYDVDFFSRIARDREHRAEFIPGYQFDLHTVLHQKELDPAFMAAFGWEYGNFIATLRNIIEGCQPVPNGFPTLFVRLDEIVRQLVTQGAPQTAVERMLNGFTVSPLKMREEGRVIWNPKQEHRAYHRGFLSFPHESGPHIAFSRQMAFESMIHLVHGVVYKRLPKEWSSPEMQPALERLSRQASLWFENIVTQNMTKLGISGGRAKEYIRGISKNIEMPAQVGEIDFLGINSNEGLLVVVEAKMVNSGLEAKYWRDDVDTFVTGKNSYAEKFRRKIEWIKSSCREIGTALGASSELQVAPVMVTLYPCIAATFIPDFPCVSLAEFVLDYKELNKWPYQLSCRDGDTH